MMTLSGRYDYDWKKDFMANDLFKVEIRDISKSFADVSGQISKIKILTKYYLPSKHLVNDKYATFPIHKSHKNIHKCRSKVCKE